MDDNQIIDVPPPAAPSAESIELTKAYYIAAREDLLRHVTEIETFLGFMQESVDLSVRVAKLEAFLGLKG